MRKYYLINASLESTLQNLQQNWLNQSEKAYTILTGHYKKEIASEDIETLHTSILLQDKQNYIEKKFGFADLDNELYKATITHFILELDTNHVPGPYIDILENTEGVLMFTSSQELLNYLK